MNFEPMNFVTSLAYLAKGMIGIMVVMGAIILVTMLLNKISSKKKED
jgi:hypothetical protein